MTIFSLSIDGGFNSEAGPSAGFRLKDNTVVSVPWLVRANNVVYNLDGWPQKMPGASKVNSSATGAGNQHMMGIFDYWRSTAAGDPTQDRVCYSGTAIYKEDVDGVWDSLATGLEEDKMPAFEVMNDNLVMASNSNVDVPQTYNQTTIANLGGTPPNFAFHCYHKRRMWAAGVDTNKSRVYYTVFDTEADWVGAGSGSIDISMDDGDVLTGLVSHKDELILFKGPNIGSIWRITGSAPTGADAFVLHPFIRGVGSTSHQSIIRFRDDLVFWDDLGIHSLVATAAYGDYNEAFLSAPIATEFTKNLNHNRFRFVWGQNFVTAGYALWTVSTAGATTNNLVLIYDYRFNPPRFARWPSVPVASIAIVKDTSRETVPWFGSYTGYAWRGNREARDWDGTAYNADILLPYLSFGDPFLDKQCQVGRVGYAPKGQTTFTVGYQRDGSSQQTVSVTQSGTSSLGSSSDQFLLDSATAGILGGGRHLNRFFDMSGQFKEIQIELSQGGLDVDFEPHSFALDVEGAGIGTTEPLG